jgi:hypothetical protein
MVLAENLGMTFSKPSHPFRRIAFLGWGPFTKL